MVTKNVNKRVSKKIAKKAKVSHVKAKPIGKNTHKSIKNRSAPRIMAKNTKAKHLESNVDKRSASKHTSTANVEMPENAKRAIETILANQKVIDYLNKNISKRSVEVISMLSTPKTDEVIAATLNMKVNAVRRILNIMQGYGITNYYISKNTNGWLSFAWFINANKLQNFFDYVESMTKDRTIINDNSNDYFICKKCFDSDKLIYTFDAAFESNFRCKVCNAKLDHIEKSEVEALTNTTKKPVLPLEKQLSTL
ncbi:MAG: hypothetical protein ACP5RM_03100 [Candidatus Micrarchaeia archaeon]